MENPTQYYLWLTKAKEHLAANDPTASKRLVELALRSNPLHSDDLVDRIAAVADVLLAAPSNDPLRILQLPADPRPSPAAVISSYRRLSLLLHPHRLRNRSLPFSARAFRIVSAAYSQLSPAGPTATTAATAASFWTLCPSCFHVHEYAADHIGKDLLCRNCRWGFTAIEMATPPEIVEGTNMYRCTWGLFPVGLLGGPTDMGRECESTAKPAARKRAKPAARKSVRPCKKKVLGTVVVEDEDDVGDAWG